MLKWLKKRLDKWAEKEAMELDHWVSSEIRKNMFKRY